MLAFRRPCAIFYPVYARFPVIPGPARVRGFTILEMLLVLTIAVFAMAVAVPNFSSGLASVNLRGASRDIASALRYLRGHAVSREKQAEFFIDVEKKVYTVSGKSGEFAIPDEFEVKLLTARSEIVGEGQGYIRFYPDGSSTGGRVTLTAGGNRRIVDVNWLTGHVEMFSETVDE